MHALKDTLKASGRQGRADQHPRRSQPARRPGRQGRQPHDRQLAPHQAQQSQSRDERGRADGHPRRRDLLDPQGADQELRQGGRGLRDRPGAVRRRRHRPRLRPRQRPGRRDGRVPRRHPRHGAQPREPTTSAS